MNERVIFIDDEIKEGSPYGKKLKNLIEEKCNRRLSFINKAEDVDQFIESPGDIRLVLLDRDLSKMRRKSIDILNTLHKKNIPVIILSRYKPIDKPEGIEDFRKLDKRLDYLLKSDIEDSEKEEFVKNLINRAIDDRENEELMAVVECNTGRIKILWKDTGEVITDDILLNHNPDWRTRSEPPVYPQEAILRILYEMGKGNLKEIKISYIYIDAPTNIISKKEYETIRTTLIDIKDKKFIPKDLKSKIDELLQLINNKKEIHLREVKKIISGMEAIYNQDKRNVVIKEAIESLSKIGVKKIQLPPKFNDALSSFNEKVREKTKGLVVGNLLKGSRGSGKDLYRANIGKIVVEEAEDVEKSPPLMAEIKEELKKIEKRLEKIEADIKTVKTRLNIS